MEFYPPAPSQTIVYSPHGLSFNLSAIVIMVLWAVICLLVMDLLYDGRKR